MNLCGGKLGSLLKSARTKPQRAIIVGLLAIAATTGLYYGLWWYHLKRFTVLAPGVFYRVAQPTEFGLRHLVEHYGVRTLVSLQLFDFRLYRGIIDPGEPNGDLESEYARKIGIQHVQWPMGDEQCWPWPDPWELEELLRLVDDPSNRPVLIHCMGGRHRTGSLSALYRVEYDRWTPDEALKEMYTYSFGLPVPPQERNLRTYVPRPLPSDAEWPTVAATYNINASESAASAMPVLAHRIRHDAEAGLLRKRLADDLAERRPYALALASRVIQRTDDPLLSIVVPQAREVLESQSAAERELAAAASLIADFGGDDDQKFLLNALEQESQSPAPTAYYEALVCGVTSRYTPNRLVFLKPLLNDQRLRPSERMHGITYAGTATVRIAAMTDGVPLLMWSEQQLDADGPQAARDWLSRHADEVKLSRLLPPSGRRVARQGEGSLEEDTSKMRR